MFCSWGKVGNYYKKTKSITRAQCWVVVPWFKRTNCKRTFWAWPGETEHGPGVRRYEGICGGAIIMWRLHKKGSLYRFHKLTKVSIGEMIWCPGLKHSQKQQWMWGRPKKYQGGRMLTITEKMWWKSGGPLCNSLYFRICLEFSKIQSFTKQISMSGLVSWFQHSLAVWPRESYCTSLGLTVTLCKIRIRMVPASETCGEDWGGDTGREH